MDLEWYWLDKKNPVWLYLRFVDEPSRVLGRAPKPYMAPDVERQMRELIEKHKQGKLWARDWKLMLLWGESLDEGDSLYRFCREHAAEGEKPKTLQESMKRLQRRMKRLASALEVRSRDFTASWRD